MTRSEAGPVVLVVDDELALLTLVGQILQERGYTVLAAKNADDATALMDAAGQAMFAVVTDINLGPGCGNGWDIGRHGRRVHPDVAVIYMSGDSPHLWRAEGVPDSTMLSKPFAPSRILSALAAVRSGGSACIAGAGE